MQPKVLTTNRLTLDIPTPGDIDEINEICQDELIQKWTTVPVPYTRDSAVFFIEQLAIPGWEKDSPTWFIREISEKNTDDGVVPKGFEAAA